MEPSADHLDAILARLRRWPAERQADAMLLLHALEDQGLASSPLSDGERLDLGEAMEEFARGETAGEDEVKAVFDRYRR